MSAECDELLAEARKVAEELSTIVDPSGHRWAERAVPFLIAFAERVTEDRDQHWLRVRDRADAVEAEVKRIKAKLRGVLEALRILRGEVVKEMSR